MFLLYNLLLGLTPLIGWPLVLFLLLPAKRRSTIAHRLGLTIDSWIHSPSCQLDQDALNTPRGSLRPIWIHALSVGEVLSARPIVNRLVEQIPRQPFVFSSSTMTGIAMARRLFGSKTCLVFYFPYDFPFSVRRVVKRIDPCLMVIIETDIWPNFLYYLKKRGIPVVLTNARLSLRSSRNYRLAGRFIRQVLSCIDEIGVQSPQDAIRFNRLGAPGERISVVGNVKFDQPQLHAPESYGRQLRSGLGIDQEIRIIVAGSTHAGEEEHLMRAYRQLQPRFPDLKMFLAPRDPERAPDIRKICRMHGFDSGFLSDLHGTGDGLDRSVLIVNAIGILSNLYALADVAFIGGSLVPSGGHNPLEPAAWAKPIVFGPHMSDFKLIGDLLKQSGAAVCVSDDMQLADTLADLLADKQLGMTMGKKAQDVLSANRGATERTLTLIATHLSLGKNRQ